MYDIKVSILIPIFNWDVKHLLLKLLEEIQRKPFQNNIELVLIDDSSNNVCLKDKNRMFIEGYSSQYPIQYFELQKNIGRSAIRNLLVQYSRGDFLLFLDSDVLPDSDEFLTSYYQSASLNEWDVVCGGISYKIRFVQGKEYDFYMYFFGRLGTKSAAERNVAPWRQMLTSNIMIRRTTFNETPFNEQFIGYGYEDNEWGIRLMNNYRVLHIDNTVSHLGLHSKNEIYEKMRESIQGYSLLATLHPQVFKSTRIALLVKLLQVFPMKILQKMDKLLRWLYFAIDINLILGVLFQINKALLLAIYQKKLICEE